MSTKRVAKIINNPEDLEMFYNLKEEDITTTFIVETFGKFRDTSTIERARNSKPKSKYNQYDILHIPPNTYKGNKNTFTTTLGLWIFNKFFIEKELFDTVGYINSSITKSKSEEINQSIVYAILEDRLDVDIDKRYIQKTQFFMPFVTILSPSTSLDMLLITKPLNKRKKELLKKYEKEIKAGDAQTADLIQKELLAYAKELLKDDPAMDIYNSGARGSFNNNFKNMFVMRGAIKDPDPTKGYNIITSNYMDGVSADEYVMLANSLAAGPYARAKKTEVGGYLEKLFLSAYQDVKLDKAGSDCGTNRFIELKLEKDIIKDVMYCYIKEGNRLVELNSTNMDKYLNKYVKLRFASLCESKTGICNKCAGELFYKLDIENIGVAMPQLASRLKVLQLKLFHDSQINYVEMDPMRAFGLK